MTALQYIFAFLGAYLTSGTDQCNETCAKMKLLCWPSIETANTTDLFSKLNKVCSNPATSSKWKHSYDPSYNSVTKQCMGYKDVPREVSCFLAEKLPANVSRLCNCQNASK